MPIYEYRCDACGAETEIMHKISEKPSLKCPSCGKTKLKKIVSAAGFRLSGAGWYETDFKSDKKKNIAGEAADKKAGDPAEKKTAEPPEKKTGDSGDRKLPDAAAAKPKPAEGKPAEGAARDGKKKSDKPGKPSKPSAS